MITDTLKIQVHEQKCMKCNLYLNQRPHLDKIKESHFMWVGLSSVYYDNGDKKTPLSSLTKSGSLIKQIEETTSRKVSYYKTNLVKCLPLLENNKIRYPKQHEMEYCYPLLNKEIELIQPRIVFLLGGIVSKFVLAKFGMNYNLSGDFKYHIYSIDGTDYVPIHHPSFILIYRRKNIGQYISSVVRIIDNFEAMQLHEHVSCAIL